MAPVPRDLEPSAPVQKTHNHVQFPTRLDHGSSGLVPSRSRIFQGLRKKGRERGCCGSVSGAGNSSYLLIAIAMMTGSQPEYSTSRVAAFFLAMMNQMGSRATKKAHTRGFT